MFEEARNANRERGSGRPKVSLATGLFLVFAESIGPLDIGDSYLSRICPLDMYILLSADMMRRVLVGER